jgi:hypothetical protein
MVPDVGKHSMPPEPARRGFFLPAIDNPGIHEYFLRRFHNSTEQLVLEFS